MLIQLTKQDVKCNNTLISLYGDNRFKYKWFSDTRNRKLLMNEFVSSDKSLFALRMPDQELYQYIGDSSIFESNNAYLYQHLKERDRFYDPVNAKPIYRYAVSN